MANRTTLLAMSAGVVTGAFSAALALLPGPLGHMERFLLTTRMERFDAHRPAPKVVLVDADEDSIETFGQWPWPRRRHAELIDRLTGWGARVIAFDMVFAEPAADPSDDDALARAIRGSGRVLLASYPSETATLQADDTVSGDLVKPLARFQAPHASANLPLDTDKYVRQLPEPTQHGEPTLAWAIYERLDPTGAARFSKRYSPGDTIRMAGPRQTYPTVSYRSVLEGVLDPRVDATFHPDRPSAVHDEAALFKDAVVLVGSSALTQHDLFPAAFASSDQRMMPGLELHANALGTLLQGNARHQAPLPVSVALTLLLPALGAWLMQRGKPLIGVVGQGALAGAFVLGNLALYAQADTAVWLAAPLIAQGASGACLLTMRLWSLDREKRRIRDTFSRYVAPSVVDHILKHPERYSLSAAERREVTVLFADVQGFTSLSEKLPAQQVERLLNGYLSAMTHAIFEARGTLDKYIGDGIMAVWGNLGDQTPGEAALNACQAALAMQDAARRLADEWIQEGLPPLIVRIGLHSGEALVGNFGSDLKLDFTVIGDVVNTASRLEALNKSLDTRILISGATHSLVHDHVEALPKGEQEIRGKTGSLPVLELIALARRIPASQPALTVERNPE